MRKSTMTALRRFRAKVSKLWRAFRYALAQLDLSEESQIEWHRAELMRLDTRFVMQNLSMELSIRRDKFYAAGGDPMSPECPDIFGVLKDWGFDPFRDARVRGRPYPVDRPASASREEHF